MCIKIFKLEVSRRLLTLSRFLHMCKSALELDISRLSRSAEVVSKIKIFLDHVCRSCMSVNKLYK